MREVSNITPEEIELVSGNAVSMIEATTTEVERFFSDPDELEEGSEDSAAYDEDTATVFNVIDTARHNATALGTTQLVLIRIVPVTEIPATATADTASDEGKAHTNVEGAQLGDSDDE